MFVSGTYSVQCRLRGGALRTVLSSNVCGPLSAAAAAAVVLLQHVSGSIDY